MTTLRPTPSARFLAMLPSALVTGTDPDDLPPLLAMLGALEQQWLQLAAGIDSVLDDAFADSVADWALPQLAALLGLPPDAGRTEVGSATALRRRRGTPAALEDFAMVVTGWPARVTEGWQTMVWSQQIAHPVRRTAAIDLRAGQHLLVGSELDPARHSFTPGGPHHPAAATVAAYPWQVLRYNATTLCPTADPARFGLHPLGVTAPLYLRPEPLTIASDAEDERPPGSPPTLRPPRSPGQLPLRASWRLIQALAPNEIGYGPAWSLGAGHPLVQGAPDDPPLIGLAVDDVPVPWTSIRLASLPPGSGPVPAADEILVDANRGVVTLGSAITGTVRATFYRPAAGELGALASRSEPDELAGHVIVVDPSGAAHAPGQLVVPDLDAAVTAALALTEVAVGAVHEVEIRLATNDRLAAPTSLTGTPALTRWRIVAPTGITPVIVGDFAVEASGLEFELAGCYLDGDLVIGPEVASVQLTGVSMNAGADRAVRVDPAAWTLRLSADRCLLGPVRADLSAFPITLSDCIVDGVGEQLQPCGSAPAPTAVVPAVAAADRFPPQLHASGCTFAGPVTVDLIEASDCVFVDGVQAVVTSQGCLRYSHLGIDLQPQAHPAGYQCRSGPLPPFGSTGVESVGYYAPVLVGPAERGADPVLTAASDGGEIGAYHHARRGPLALRLAQRVAEMTPLTVHPQVRISRGEE